MTVVTSIQRVLFGRLIEGEDMLKSITEIVRSYRVKSGVVNLIGSLKKVRVGYYDREKGVYIPKEAEGFFELVSCMGDISWKDDEPVVHIHMAVSDKKGEVLMGHVLDGNIVDATVEYVILEFETKFRRKYDNSTGLYLLDV